MDLEKYKNKEEMKNAKDYLGNISKNAQQM